MNIIVAWGFVLFGRDPDSISNHMFRVVVSISNRDTGMSEFFVFDKGSQTCGVLHDRRGWPMYGMESHTRVQFISPVSIEAPWLGIVLQRAQSETMTYPKVLPLQPAWPGFVVNTLFYAAILWMLFSAPAALVRRRRREGRLERGLCPACAYPIGSSEVCTECGQPVRTRSHAA